VASKKKRKKRKKQKKQKKKKKKRREKRTEKGGKKKEDGAADEFGPADSAIHGQRIQPLPRLSSSGAVINARIRGAAKRVSVAMPGRVLNLVG